MNNVRRIFILVENDELITIYTKLTNRLHLTVVCSITEQTRVKCNLFVLYNTIEKIPKLNR
jgi:hypothetical protein